MSRATFGVDRDAGVVMSHQAPPYGTMGKAVRKPLSSLPNPMVIAHGADPAGRRCGSCYHLVVKHDHGPRRYHGCELRGPLTAGPGTDHLVRWPACALIEEEP